MRLTFKDLISSQESIAFQGPEFFKELVSYYQNYNSDHPTYQILIDIVKKYTNLKIEVEPNEFWASSMLTMGDNHVLFKSYFEYIGANLFFDTNADLKDLLNKSKDVVLKGNIDLRNNKVHGIFEDIKFTLIIKNSDIKVALTPSECAAITLHEIGHMFTTLEYLGQETIKNIAISNAVHGTSIQDEGMRKIYLAKCADDLHLDEKAAKALSSASTGKEAYFVIMNYNNVVVKDNLSSVLKGNTYYTVNSEWVADDYATRCGAGADLVSALTKIIDKTSGFRTFCNVFTVVVSYVIPMLLAAASASSFGAVCLLATNLFMNTFQAYTHQVNKRYDFDKERFARIRNTLILNLRTQGKTSQAQLKEILKSIDDIELMMQRVASEEPAILKFHMWVAQLVSSKMSDSQKQEQFQKNLENAANNILYKQAYKASLLANTLTK